LTPGSNDQTNNQIIEKYCYQDLEANCDTFGGLFQWAEAIQYNNGASNSNSPNPPFLTGYVQGICPTDWHISSISDWCLLSTSLSSSTICTRGSDFSTQIANSLKSTQFWWNSSGTNSTGFNALPGGKRDVFSPFFQEKYFGAGFWVLDEKSSFQAENVSISYYDSTLSRSDDIKRVGYSVRCVKDPCFQTVAQAGQPSVQVTSNSLTLSANSPGYNETGEWFILEGRDAQLTGKNQSNATIFQGTDNQYTLVWQISGPCGTSSDTILITFLPSPSWSCGDSITFGGKGYSTIQISNQCWFQQNINVGNLVSSTVEQLNNQEFEKYCFGDDEANCNQLGGLYQWGEAIQYQNGSTNTNSFNSTNGNVRGICPIGWHIPNGNDWCTLNVFLDNQGRCGTNDIQQSKISGGKLKSTNLWNVPNTGASNAVYFAGLPAGLRLDNGQITDFGVGGYFWSLEEQSNVSSGFRKLSSSNSFLERGVFPKANGISVRCLKD
jgi:uncharacterized protein (TIGR02145 family)